MSKTQEPSKPLETIVAHAVASPPAEDKMLVVNHDPRCFVLPIGRGGSKSVRLKPGANFVAIEDWEDIARQAEKEPTELAGFLARDRRIEPLGVHGPRIEGLSMDKALTLVGLTYDRRTLTRWGDEETRPTIQRAIASQIAALDGSKADAA